MKVAICDWGLSDYVLERRLLGEIGAEVDVRKCDTKEQVADFAADADGIMILQHRVDAAVIERMKRCRVIARYGVGVDTIDIPAATRRGIVITNVVHYCDDEVAEHTIALLMACVRKIVSHDRKMREGVWGLYQRDPIHRMSGATLGLIGAGAIGRKIIRKLQGFEMRILVYDPYLPTSEARGMDIELVDLPVLLAQSDYVSLHAPLTEVTRHIINRETLRRMKKSAVLINASRGALVDTEALHEALRDGVIASAGLDVHETEPVPAGYPLFDLENVVLSDHNAWYSEESVEQLRRTAAESVAAVLEGRRPASVVNPEVYERLDEVPVG